MTIIERTPPTTDKAMELAYEAWTVIANSIPALTGTAVTLDELAASPAASAGRDWAQAALGFREKFHAVLAGHQSEQERQATSNLVAHARHELALVGEDPAFAESIVQAVIAFSSYGHSGGSASAGIAILYDLLQFKNLSPLTSNSDEWVDRSKESGYPLWQSKRNPAVISEDGGKTAHHIASTENKVEVVDHASPVTVADITAVCDRCGRASVEPDVVGTTDQQVQDDEAICGGTFRAP